MSKVQPLNEKNRERRQARRERLRQGTSAAEEMQWDIADLRVDVADLHTLVAEKTGKLEVQIANVYTHISNVRAELKQDISAVHESIASLKQELKGDNASLKQELKDEIHRAGWQQLGWIGGIIVFATFVSQYASKWIGS